MHGPYCADRRHSRGILGAGWTRRRSGRAAAPRPCASVLALNGHDLQLACGWVKPRHDGVGGVVGAPLAQQSATTDPRAAARVARSPLIVEPRGHLGELAQLLGWAAVRAPLEKFGVDRLGVRRVGPALLDALGQHVGVGPIGWLVCVPLLGPGHPLVGDLGARRVVGIFLRARVPVRRGHLGAQGRESRMAPLALLHLALLIL
eukprot:scaffold218018_cov31-Tisochrysis_lutea.AAC.1